MLNTISRNLLLLKSNASYDKVRLEGAQKIKSLGDLLRLCYDVTFSSSFAEESKNEKLKVRMRPCDRLECIKGVRS
jgi:hypothetical protein